MLNRCACLLTDKLCRRGVVEEQKRPVFIYGFELLMSTLSSMVSIFIFSLLLGAPYASLCFFIAFMGLRFFAGGYHAPTYRLCFITSNSIWSGLADRPVAHGAGFVGIPCFFLVHSLLAFAG